MWVVASVVALALQSLFFLASRRIVETTFDTQGQGWRLAGLPPVVFALAFGWPPLLLALCEWRKALSRRISTVREKRAKLEFGTKLGMYSPV